MAYPAFVPNDWVRDDLPDLIWPLLLVAVHGDSMAELFKRAQKLVLQSVPSEEIDRWDLRLDGRLTSVEAFPEHVQSPIVEAFSDAGTTEDVFPDSLLRILSLYEDAPGRWLLVDPWLPDRHLPPEEEAVETLARAIVQAATSEDVNALVKTAPLAWQVLRGMIGKLPVEAVEDLKGYPADLARRPAAESLIRSHFLVDKAADMELHPQRIANAAAWAKSFWTQNWTNTLCLVSEPVEPQEEDEAPSLTSEKEKVASEEALKEATRMWRSFVRSAMSRDLAVDLHEPARHEVLVALVVRAFKAVTTILRTPRQWTGEEGSHTI
jgi:hypothetical protein